MKSKRFFAWVLTAAMLLALFPVQARAAEENVTIVESDTTVWDGGIYVVNHDVTIEDLIALGGGKVILRLERGTLTTKGGIHAPKGRDLTIEGSEGTLMAYGRDMTAAIGGRESEPGGTITINGGTVIATSYKGAAGIGSGNTQGKSGLTGGTITINGGNVTAIGGADSGAGIGGGHGASCGTIIINGGTINAIGGGQGAGIGNGHGTYYYSTVVPDGSITINGGIVNASSVDGAGIGNGYQTRNGDITVNIKGGIINASSTNGAGIGGGYNATTDTNIAVNITGGIVNTSSTNGVCIGSVKDMQEGKLQVNVSGGIVFQEDDGLIYDDTLGEDFTLPVGKTLTIEEGQSLTIPEGVTLTNNGKIINNGTIIVSGAISGEGTFEGNKLTPTATAPAKIDLTYNDAEQDLVDPGKTTGGEWRYKLGEDGVYSTSVPTAIDAGGYTVYYQLVGGDLYNDVPEEHVDVTISKLQEKRPDAVFDEVNELLTGLEPGSTYSISDGGQGGAYTASENGTIPIQENWFDQSISIVRPARDENNYMDSEPQSITVSPRTEWTITVETEGSGTASATPETAYRGTEITLTAVPDPGWHLEEWQVSGVTVMDSKFTMPAGNVTVKAVFEEDSYTVTFDSQGGTAVGPITVTHGQLAAKPGNPARSGYRFDGWYTDSSCTTAWNFVDPVTQDLTLYAKWTVIPSPPPSPVYYTVSFNSQGGSKVESQSVRSGGRVSLPDAPVKEGYTFDGWYTDEACVSAWNFSDPVFRRMTLYAKWTENEIPTPPEPVSFTITFDSQGGSEVAAQTVQEGDNATQPDVPVREGFTFEGWFTEPECVHAWDFDSTVTDDVTLYAKWTENEIPTPPEPVSFTITFDSQGGSEVTAQTVQEDGMAAQPEAPVREGFTFEGWFTEPECVHAWDFDSTVTDDVTLYAKWTENEIPTPPEPVSFTVTFDSQGGSAVSSQNVKAGEKVIQPASPARSGYNFGGWYRERNCTTAWNFSVDTVTGDMTLYAMWIPVPTGGGGSYTPARPTPTYPPTVEKADQGGTVTVTPSRPSAGDKVTVTPKPDAGYQVEQVTVTGKNGKPVAVAETPDGTYTFIQPNGTVKIDVSYQFTEVTPVEKPWSNSFTDVSEGAWYYDAVQFAVEHGLMNGHDDGTFGVSDNLTRAQLAQILYNKEGRPGVNYILPFGDVSDDVWYTEAVRWATAQGIVGGYGGGLFGPDDGITREQLAVMLWRYSGSPAATNKELHFADADTASSYALEALRWAVENGILNGYINGQLDPGGLATRAQAAQMLKNFIEM